MTSLRLFRDRTAKISSLELVLFRAWFLGDGGRRNAGPPHLFDWDRHEARIADVLVHVGVSEFLGFNHEVQRVMPILGQGEVLHDIEHGERGDPLAVGGSS